MIRVGITGGMGGGKSTVCRVFALLGAPVYDSDARAKRLMESDAALAAGITALVGPGSYAGGTLDRGYLAGRIFADGSLLARINALVHPAVAADFEAWAAAQTARYVLVESAILFESGLAAIVDDTIAVSAPEQVRVARVAARSGLSADDIRARMERQSASRAESLARHVIVNDGHTLVVPQVVRLDKFFAG